MKKRAFQHKQFDSVDGFFEQLQNNAHPVVIDFWADWCGPCRVIDPFLEALSKEYEGEVDVWKVNADDHPQLLSAMRIRGIPTLIGFYNGAEMGRRTGAAPKLVLETVFRTALAGKVGGPPAGDRRIRVWIGTAFIVLGLTSSFLPAVKSASAIMGVLMFIWAYYDLLPFWPALHARLNKK